MADQSSKGVPSIPPRGNDPKDIKKFPCVRCGVLRSENEGGGIFTYCDDCWGSQYSDEKKMHFRCSHCNCATFDIMLTAKARTDIKGKRLTLLLGENPRPKVLCCARCHAPIPLGNGVKCEMKGPSDFY